jgi:16S rRNA (cytosine1402-N4)-methyltransferase
MNTESAHIPILLEPIVIALTENLRAAREPAYIVDCTLGGGGHTRGFLAALAGTPHRVLAFDQDAEAVARARLVFSKEISAGRLELVHSRFSRADGFLAGKNVMGLLADLGFSSDQLDDPERGLSFQGDGPLDMRLDPSEGESCFQLLQRIREQELADLLWELGEERYSRRIAATLVRFRAEGHLPRTTKELSELILRAVPPHARHQRIHAATRTFQALRIAVNDELNELDQLLARVILSVNPGGRVAILSFHSLEDRRVKSAFRGKGFERLTKKPAVADAAEIERNPRARSAKLRIAQRQEPNENGEDAESEVSEHEDD